MSRPKSDNEYIQPRGISPSWLVLLFLLAPPIALYLLSVVGKAGNWILNPFALGSFLTAETLAFWGVLFGMIAVGFPFWKILLGLSALFLFITVLNLFGRVIFSN